MSSTEKYDPEEPFVLWKSTRRCQDAFKSVGDGATEVMGQLKSGEGRWTCMVPQQGRIL